MSTVVPIHRIRDMAAIGPEQTAQAIQQTPDHRIEA